jgi:hypothetical protein
MTFVEKQRGLGLIDQRRDVADVDRLVQIHKLARLPQPVQELAEILFHGVSSGRWGAGR